MPVKGQRLVASNIHKFGGGFERHVNKVMVEVKKELSDEVKKNITQTTYSLADLKSLDHPYAGRHGEKGLKVSDPYWLVNKHSGKLEGSQYDGTVRADITGGELEAAAYVGVDENDAKHALYVIFGTNKMIPRDFLTGSLEAKRESIGKLLQGELKDFVFNFRGV